MSENTIQIIKIAQGIPGRNHEYTEMVIRGDIMIEEKRYCIYLRKSRADADAEARGEGETLLRHEKTLLELSERMHIKVEKIYREIVSGDTIAARPVMQELLTDVESMTWTGVLVMEVERLARGDTIDQGIVARTFQITNTQIITPLKTYDPQNESDEEYFEFGLFMSRREYKTINRRLNRGRIQSVKEGKYIASVAPYGYIRVKLPNEKGYTLSPHPEQADVVRMIFDLYVNGLNGEEYGATKIARYLDSLGIKPMVADKWSPASIRDILQNEVYVNKIVWGKRKEVKTVENGVVKIMRPTAADYLCNNALHEGLVTQEIFDKAQYKRTHSPHSIKVNVKKPLQNPLAGLIYCDKCGSLMTRLGESKKTPYAFLKCPNRYCDNVSVPLFLVEKNLIAFLQDWIKNYQIEIESGANTSYESQLTLLQSSEQALDKEKQNLLKQLNNAYNLVEQGVYTADIFKSRNQILTSQIHDVDIRLSEIREKISEANEHYRMRTELVPRAYTLIQSYNQLSTAAEKNALLNQLVSKATILKTERNTRGKRDNSNFALNVWPKLPHA